MDLNVYSSVGTQTPTEDFSFEFPECFSPSPSMSRSSPSSSSIGTQTSVVSRRSSHEFELPFSNSACQRPKLFRRHSTGSDVYNFTGTGGSATLLAAFRGAPFAQRGILAQRMVIGNPLSSGSPNGNAESQNKADLDETNEDFESVGLQLRKIGDDLDRGGHFRSRSLSVSRFLVSVRRRTSSSSS